MAPRPKCGKREDVGIAEVIGHDARLGVDTVELVYKVFIIFYVLSKAYSILFSSGINAGCLRGCGCGGGSQS